MSLLVIPDSGCAAAADNNYDDQPFKPGRDPSICHIALHGSLSAQMRPVFMGESYGKLRLCPSFLGVTEDSCPCHKSKGQTLHANEAEFTNQIRGFSDRVGRADSLRFLLAGER